MLKTISAEDIFLRSQNLFFENVICSNCEVRCMDTSHFQDNCLNGGNSATATNTAIWYQECSATANEGGKISPFRFGYFSCKT